MKHTQSLFRQSYFELKNIRTITTCALFAAIAVVLGYFTIQIGDFIKIGFSSVPNEIISYLFGPVVGSAFGAILDIIKYMIKPTGGFFPGFTITAILAGFLNGCFLYQKKITITRILFVNFIVILLCDILLNTYWLSILYGKGFFVLFPMRVLKNIIMWPIDSIILYSVLKILKSTGVLKNSNLFKG